MLWTTVAPYGTSGLVTTCVVAPLESLLSLHHTPRPHAVCSRVDLLCAQCGVAKRTSKFYRRILAEPGSGWGFQPPCEQGVTLRGTELLVGETNGGSKQQEVKNCTLCAFVAPQKMAVFEGSFVSESPTFHLAQHSMHFLVLLRSSWQIHLNSGWFEFANTLHKERNYSWWQQSRQDRSRKPHHARFS